MIGFAFFIGVITGACGALAIAFVFIATYGEVYDTQQEKQDRDRVSMDAESFEKIHGFDAHAESAVRMLGARGPATRRTR